MSEVMKSPLEPGDGPGDKLSYGAKLVMLFGIAGAVGAWFFPVAVPESNVVNIELLQRQEMLFHAALAVFLAGIILFGVSKMIQIARPT